MYKARAGRTKGSSGTSKSRTAGHTKRKRKSSSSRHSRHSEHSKPKPKPKELRPRVELVFGDLYMPQGSTNVFPGSSNGYTPRNRLVNTDVSVVVDDDDEELPSLGEESPKRNEPLVSPGAKRVRPKKLRKTKAKTKKTKTKTQARKKTGRTSKKASTSRTRGLNMDLAEMETDTELDYESTESNDPDFEQITLSSSSEDEQDMVKYGLKLFPRKYAKMPLSRKPADVVDLVSRSPTPEPNDDNYPFINVWVRFREKTFKVNVKECWDLERLREQLSTVSGVPDGEILLYDEKEQKLMDGKTLEFYNIAAGSFLEALRKDFSKSACVVQSLTSIKFQKEGMKKPLIMNVSKFSSLKEIRTMVAKEISRPEKKLYFQVDGETLDLHKTPGDLDLEDEVIIDIFEKN